MSDKMNWRDFDVNRPHKYEHLVTRLCATKADINSTEKVFRTIKEFMVFAALVGFENNLYEPIVKGEKKVSISLGTYSKTEHDAYIYLIAITKESDVSVLSNSCVQKAIKHYEAYCNGGLNYINDWVLESIDDNLGANTLFNKAFDYLSSTH